MIPLMIAKKYYTGWVKIALPGMILTLLAFLQAEVKIPSTQSLLTLR